MQEEAGFGTAFPRIIPMSKTAFIFPGQGSQYIGMGRDLHAQSATVRQLYEHANDILGYDLRQLCFEGPAETLNLTRHTQPALLVHSLACLEALRERHGTTLQADVVGGHSLGEYTALVAAGWLDFATALRTVQRRGDLMGEYGEGEMLALSLPREAAEAMAMRHHCAVAACNLPEQTVVGGRDSDLAALVEGIEDKRVARRAVRLKTEGAFHTYYMVEAARHFRPHLAAIAPKPSAIQVMSNYTGTVHADHDIEALRAALFFQLFHPVRWIDNLHALQAMGVRHWVELGGGLGKGEGAEGKRPNLEGIVKKAMQAFEIEDYSYRAVIHAESLDAFA